MLLPTYLFSALTNPSLPVYLVALGSFLIPLKLSLAYICFIPAVLLSLFSFNLKRCFTDYSWFIRLFGAFFILLAVSVLLGIDPLPGIRGLLSLLAAFQALLIVATGISDKRISPVLIVAALIGGQAIAGLHSIFETSVPFEIKRIFLGAVTESGQLALTVPLSVGILFASSKNIGKHSLLLTIGTLLISFLAFWKFTYIVGGITLLAAYLLIQNARPFKKFHSEKFLEKVSLLLAVILISAIIVNLKRGPWFGIIGGLLLLTLSVRPTLSVLFLVGSMATISLFQPVRDRLLQSLQHFTITGGRQEIWDIGLYLIERFPMGIGFKNSPFLHEYALHVPSNLKHFHSNILNIAVEGGLFTLFFFLLWNFYFIFYLAKAGWKSLSMDNNLFLLLPIACSLISWQIAGLVEYNFGDSEVLYIAFILMGVALGILSINRIKPPLFYNE